MPPAQAGARNSRRAEVRVLHILDHSIPLQTGYALRTQAILKEQRARNWETFQLTGPNQGPTLEREEKVDGWDFFRTPPPGGLLEDIPVVSQLEAMGDIAYRIEQAVKRIRPHILHAHSPALNVLPALRVGHRLGTPVVYEVRSFSEDLAVERGAARDNGTRYRLIRRVETWALRRADAVTAATEGLRRDIIARGVRDEDIAVVPDGLDVEGILDRPPETLDLKRPLGLEGALVLGFIGAFQGPEGIDLLLQALPQIQVQLGPVRLLLVGTGPDEARLREACAAIPGVAGSVVFKEPLSGVELNACYDLVDILVYPRLASRLADLSCPLEVLQGMARTGLMVLSDVGGHRELVRDGETGVLFRAGDVAALVASVVELARSHERWTPMKSAARDFVLTDRNWKVATAGYERTYARLTPEARLR